MSSNKKNKNKILIIDDEDTLRDVLRVILDKEFEIIEASNGIEGIELYRKHKPDIVLMDIMMPLMDGIEATKRILEIDKDATILAITAYSKRKGDEIIKAGAKDILPKPFRRGELIKFIYKYL